MPRGQPSQQRYDVWTDAGRERGDLFLLAADVSPSAAYATMRLLRQQQWRVELRPTAHQARWLSGA